MLLYQVLSVLLTALFSPANALIRFDWDIHKDPGQRGLQSLDYKVKFLNAERQYFFSWEIKHNIDLIRPCGQSGRIYTEIGAPHSPLFPILDPERYTYFSFRSDIKGSKPMKGNCHDLDRYDVIGVACGKQIELQASGHEFRIMLSLQAFKEFSLVTALLIIDGDDQKPQLIGGISVPSDFTGMNSKEQAFLGDDWRVYHNDSCDILSKNDVIFYPVRESKTSTILSTLSNFTVEPRGCPDATVIYKEIGGNAIQFHVE